MPPRITTSNVKPWTAQLLPEPDSLPPRPEDGDALGVLLSWAAASVWPDGVQPIPLEVEGWRVALWPGFHHVPLSVADTGGLYAWHQSRHLLATLACAEVTGRVNGPAAGEVENLTEVMPLFVDGYRVVLDSWRYLSAVNEFGNPAGDSDDLWRWAWSRRELPQPMATREHERRLPGALRTGQAVADALYVLLPQAEPPAEAKPAVAAVPTNRRNSWR